MLQEIKKQKAANFSVAIMLCCMGQIGQMGLRKSSGLVKSRLRPGWRGPERMFFTSWDHDGP